MSNRLGPEIIISPSITGGQAYHYDEVIWMGD
jgi:hypothetical protein